MIHVIDEHSNDKFNLSFILFTCIGFLMETTHLFIASAEVFWKFKFRKIELELNNGSQLMNERLDELQSYFSLIGITVPIAVVAADIFFLKKWNTILRLLGCFFGYICIFSLMVLFAFLDTDSWQHGFFYTIISLYLIATIVKNLFFATLIYTFTGFPVIFITALTIGQAICGIFSSGLKILALLINISPKNCGLLFFFTGLACVFIINAVFFVILRHSTFFHDRIKELAIKQKEGKQPELAVLGAVFRRQRIIFFGLLFAAGATKIVQPDLASKIRSAGFGQGNIWDDAYFVPVVTLFVFYICDLLGKIAANKIADYITNKTMLILAICRLVLVPLLFILNVTQKEQIGMVFRSDVLHIIYQIILGITNGLGINICIIRASRKYPIADEANSFTVLLMLLGGVLLCDVFSSIGSLINKFL